MFILTINPGSTSTKVAIFENENCIFQKNTRHSVEELSPYSKISEQFAFRKDALLHVLENEAFFDLKRIDCIVARGGLLKPMEAGIYEVNETMLGDLRKCKYGEHASNLGGLIAYEIAAECRALGRQDVKAYIADPVVVDELENIARISGHPLFPRMSIFHPLNQRAVARRYAHEMNTSYDKLRLIVAHLGGGISVGVHKYGRIVDVNNALNGDGPFSPERSGGLPAFELADVCFSGKYTLEEIKKMITGKGGYVAYLGTNDAREVENRVLNGDIKAALIQDALAYQVSKEIGAMATVLKGKVDAIILTGGMAYGRPVVKIISDSVGFIAPIKVYPGEDEMLALAENAVLLSEGKLDVKVYM
ncbi:MAG: butyrate kinase [Bacteroidales bacterium]|jgi:butyrate kinase|nr:butyrate kinase [Bacteroidales bacterium]